MAVNPGLCRTWSKIPKTGFLTTRLILGCLHEHFEDILGTNCATPHETPLNFYHSTIKCAVIIFDFHLKLDRFPLPLGAWDGLRYFIVTLPEPSI